jgi:hypothetical protein
MQARSFVAAIIAGIVLVVSPAIAQAQGYQGPDVAEQRVAMERLAPLAGRWQGEADVVVPRAMTVHQTERVEHDLTGLVLVIHGEGFANAEHTGDAIFNAMAVISYNDRADIYEFRSYTATGYATTATGQFLEDGSFRWSIVPEGSPVHIRFTIAFDATTWREVGEISYDRGATWSRTITMDLRKIQ